MDENELKIKRKEKILQRAQLGMEKVETAILNKKVSSLKTDFKPISNKNLNDSENKNIEINKKLIQKIKTIIFIVLGVLFSIFLDTIKKFNIIFLILIISLSFNFLYFRNKKQNFEFKVKGNERVKKILNVFLKYYDNFYFILSFIDDLSSFIIPFLIMSSIYH